MRKRGCQITPFYWQVTVMRRNGDWNSKEKGNDVQFGNERKWRVESRQHGWLKERASEYFASPSGPWHPLTAKILLSAPAPYTYIHLTSTNCLSYTYICKKHLAKYCALKNGLIESFYGFSLILNKCLSTPACVFFLLFSLVLEFFNNLSLWWISQKHKGLPPS